MPSVNLIWSLLLMLAFARAGNYGGSRAAAPRLELRVSEMKVNADLFPGARGYSAKLTNSTKESIAVEVHQAPPGVFGGGIFYPCAVQFWNSKTKDWQIQPPGNRRDKNGVGQY